MHARHRRGLPVIDLHLALVTDHHAHRFQPEVGTVAPPPRGEEHGIEVTIGRPIVPERHHGAAVALQLAQTIAKMDLHTLVAQVLGKLPGQFRIETFQQAFAPDQQRHAAAKCLEQPGQLNCDVAATDDRDPLRCTAQIEEIIGDQAQFGTGNVRALGMGTGCDQNVRGADPYTIAALHGVRIHQAATTRHPHHLVFIQALEIAGMDIGDVGLAMHHQLFPIQ
ncbi:hypothetical protein D3C71_1085630 [compost metagenome]